MLSSRLRQLYAHAAAAAIAWVDIDVAAVARRHFLRHGEAEADVPLRRALGGEERLEHLVAQLVGDTGAGVLDAHLEVIRLYAVGDAQLARAAALSVHRLDGIGDELAEQIGEEGGMRGER